MPYKGILFRTPEGDFLFRQVVEKQPSRRVLESRLVRRSAATPPRGLSAGATIWLFLNNLSRLLKNSHLAASSNATLCGVALLRLRGAYAGVTT